MELHIDGPAHWILVRGEGTDARGSSWFALHIDGSVVVGRDSRGCRGPWGEVD
jgi:hypothetical protein